MHVHDVVIIGAGIAGLSAAWELRKRGITPLILERSNRAGGVITTERTDGFVIDTGPDSLLVQKPAAVELCAELGIREQLVSTLAPRTAFVVRRGQLLPIPAGSFLGLPTQVGPFARSNLFSWPAKLRMATEVIRSRHDAPDESIGSFMRRRFGAEAVEYLAEPLLAGIHAGDVDLLSVHALFPRLVALEQDHGSVLRGLRATAATARPVDGAFLSFLDGLAVLPENLVARLGDVVRYNTAVSQMSGAAPYKLTLDTDAALHARAVIVATPAWAAARIFRSIDTVLAHLCEQVTYASTATVALAFRREQIAHPLSGTGFVVPRRERKTLMAGTWASSKWPNRAPADFVLLRGFVGGVTDAEVLMNDDATLVSRVVDDMRRLLNIDGEPALVRIQRWPRATPQYVVGHLARVRAIDERLSRMPGVLVTGSGYRGTGIPDCIADARLTAARAADALRALR